MKSRGSLPPETTELLGPDFVGDVGRFVYPIFSDKDGEPDSVGSGFIVNFNGLHCLISAAHVLDRLTRGETLFWYSRTSELRRVVGQGILHRLPSGARREDDQIDIGVVILEEPGLPPYSEIGKEALPGDRLLLHAAPRTDRKYVVLGFPASKADVNRSEKSVRSAAYSYLASSVPGATYIEMGLNEDSHVVLPFDTKRIFHLDGRRMNFPKPAGISGAPLWELRRPDEGGPRVVGVMIERNFARKVMIAADVGFAVRMLRDYLVGVAEESGVISER